MRRRRIHLFFEGAVGGGFIRENHLAGGIHAGNEVGEEFGAGDPVLIDPAARDQRRKNRDFPGLP